MRFLIPIAFILVAGCGAPDRVRERADAPLCSFEGPWWASGLRSSHGINAVWVRGAPGRGHLVRSRDELRVEVELERGGWSVRGFLDARRDWPLSVREPLQFADGVVVPPGTPLLVLDAREGEALVTIVSEHDDEVRYLIPITPRWLPCSALQPVSLPPEVSGVFSCATTTDRDDVIAFLGRGPISFSLEPGAPPFAEVSPRLSLPVGVRERRGEYARVGWAGLTGVPVEGWVRASELLPPEPREPHTRVLEPRAELPPMERCTSREPLIVHVRSGFFTSEDEIARVAPGTPFFVVGADEDELSISPVDLQLGPALAMNLSWRVRPTTAPMCVQVVEDRGDAPPTPSSSDASMIE